MKAAELVALAAAHGVDLVHVAGSASNTHGIAARRRQSRDERAARIPVLQTVRGGASRTYRPPKWHTGDYCQDVPRMPWLAACHSFAGDSSGYAELHRGLMTVGLKIATEKTWPMVIRRHDGSRGYYQAELAALVLDADMHRRMFAEAPALYWLCVGCHQDLWDHVVVHWYDDLKAEYDRWLGTARGIIQHWINEDSGQAA